MSVYILGVITGFIGAWFLYQHDEWLRWTYDDYKPPFLQFCWYQFRNNSASPLMFLWSVVLDHRCRECHRFLRASDLRGGFLNSREKGRCQVCCWKELFFEAREELAKGAKS